MKSDIQSRADIQIFVDAFYAKMPSDDLVGHVFMDVMHVDFAKHLPKMYDFWEMLLLDGSAWRSDAAAFGGKSKRALNSGAF